MKKLNETLKEESPLEAADLMKTASISLALSSGQTIIKQGVTPAEVEVLIALHAVNAKGEPIKDLVETEAVKRGSSQEVGRLLAIYGAKAVRSVFGPNAALPGTFREAISTALAWTNEHGEVESTPLVGRTPTPAEIAAFK